jgi:hypothetical protein
LALARGSQGDHQILGSAADNVCNGRVGLRLSKRTDSAECFEDTLVDHT